MALCLSCALGPHEELFLKKCTNVLDPCLTFSIEGLKRIAFKKPVQGLLKGSQVDI
jgi:hypothetical protein